MPHLSSPKRKVYPVEIKNKSISYQFSLTCQIPNLNDIYNKYFGDKRGIFVEVGAYDGESVSNTSGLADAGWRGIYIEPVPEYYKLCKKRHKKNKNIKVIKKAIGDSKKRVKIYIGGVLSTIDSKMVEAYNSIEWAKGHHQGRCVNVKQITLDSLLEKYNTTTGFDLLVIDVEGYEWNVFKGFSLAFWRPKVVIIEIHDSDKKFDFISNNCAKIIELFKIQDYKLIYKDLINCIYIDIKHYGSII